MFSCQNYVISLYHPSIQASVFIHFMFNYPRQLPCCKLDSRVEPVQVHASFSSEPTDNQLRSHFRRSLDPWNGRCLRPKRLTLSNFFGWRLFEIDWLKLCNVFWSGTRHGVAYCVHTDRSWTPIVLVKTYAYSQNAHAYNRRLRNWDWTRGTEFQNVLIIIFKIWSLHELWHCLVVICCVF